MKLDRKVQTLLTTVLGLCMVSCVSSKYTQVKVDSIAPPKGIAACPEVLPVGARCAAQIQANRWFTPTGIQVNAGLGSRGQEAGRPLERYCFTVPPGQVWFDKNSRAIPPYPLMPSWVHDAAEFIGLLRHKGMGYMRLMAGVASDVREREVMDVMAMNGTDADCLSTARTGALVLYPNDARSWGDNPDYYYENNHGFAWVIIERQ